MVESSDIERIKAPSGVDRMVVIVGMGGIGSWLVEPVIRYFIGMNQSISRYMFVLIDGDSYEDGNVNRQVVHPKFIGMNKASATAMRARAYFPDAHIFEIPCYINQEDLQVMLPTVRQVHVLSCVDNHVARFALERFCVQQNTWSLISGGNEEFDGNVHLAMGIERTIRNTLSDDHPEVSTTDDGDRSTMSCQDLANLEGGGQIITTNFTCASLMLEVLHHADRSFAEGIFCDLKEVFFDVNTLKTRKVDL